MTTVLTGIIVAAIIVGLIAWFWPDRDDDSP